MARRGRGPPVLHALWLLGPLICAAGLGGQNASKGNGVVDPALTAISDEPAPFRRLSDTSCTMNYKMPDWLVERGVPITVWYNTVVPKHASTATYFAAIGQGFGYMGLQQVETPGLIFGFEGRVVFSIWDHGCNTLNVASQCPTSQRAQVVECGEKAVCQRFQGEGTGFKAIMSFNKWNTDQPYGFLVRAFAAGVESVRYEGYFHAPELGGWILLAKLAVPTGGKPWSITNMYSFVEHWSSRKSDQLRWAQFGPSFVRPLAKSADSWAQVVEASLSPTTMYNAEFTLSPDGNSWGLGFGPNVVRTAEPGVALRVRNADGPPQVLLDFDRLAGTGSLPTGCQGGTCWVTRVDRWIRERFEWQQMPITGLAGLAVLVSCALCCSWLRPRGKPSYQTVGW